MKELIKKITILRKVIGPHCEISIRFKGDTPVIVGAIDRKIHLEELDDHDAPESWKDLDNITPGYVG